MQSGMVRTNVKGTVMCKTFSKIIIVGIFLTVSISSDSYALQNRISVHDPSSIIRCEDTYWIFCTGSGIRARYSTDLISWNTGPSPFPEDSFPKWINDYVPEFEDYFWAPECYYMNGRYYLYYSCSTFGSRISCIGLATNATLNPNSPDFEWVDEGLVVSSDYNVNFNAIDPAVFRDACDNLWMSFGSWNGGIRIMRLDNTTGKSFDSNRYSVATASDAEASYVVYRNGYYYLFFNRGDCCQGIDSTYYIQVGRSTAPHGGYVDMDGKELDDGGGTTILSSNQNFIGPGCIGRFVENGTEWTTFHYYDGNNEGRGTLAIGYMGWDDVNDWPYISLDWIDNGCYCVTNVNSGLVWHALNSEEEFTPAIIQETWQELDCQKWDFLSMGNGYFLITNTLGGLAAYGLESLSENDSMPILYPFSGYHVEKTNVGDYVISARNDNRVVEVPDASISTGTQLALNDYNGENNQRFYLTPIDVTINNPPEVSIVSPSDGQTFGSGASVTIDAAASDSDGSVVVVEFYNGSTKLGEDNSSPYSCTMNNCAMGNYALIAKAIDNDGDVKAAGINVTIGGRR